MNSTADVATFSGRRRRARRAGAQDGQRLLQRLEVLEAEHDSGGTTVLGDHDAPMLAFEAVDHLGEAVLHVGEGNMLCCAHGQKYG
jgi:hypothetical protein